MVVAKIAYGQKGLADLKNRFRFWRKGMKWQHTISVWGTCLFTFSTMNLATGALNSIVFASSDFTWNANLFSTNFLIGFLIATFLDAGAVFEENGWRGFALPLLQSRFNPLKASIVLGLMWFGWHIPVKFDIFFYGFGNALKLFFILMIKFVLLSIIMTFFFNQVGGTTIIAIAMHGISNDSVRLAGQILSDSYTVYLLTEINLVIPMLIVATGLVLKTKGRLGLTVSSD
ncbi:Abortive infection protein [Scytonema hofmannii PCC 7110]|uniref:Abortive infection protein n=2 Tax=Scytonema hofmannii TaxID=34078 RepID=A0A139X3P1_9CYAN|nr:Abortive infection protein [Scytonema hofmannii PCC 7110]